MKHSISKGHSTDFLKAFDEEYKNELEDSVKGGELKLGFLQSRKIPRLVKFGRRPHLDALIDELTETFAIRYEKLPMANWLDMLKQMHSNSVPSYYLEEDAVFRYQKRLNDLISPSRLADTFRPSSHDKDHWPPSDKARGQPISIGSSTERVIERKRAELDGLGSGW